MPTNKNQQINNQPKRKKKYFSLLTIVLLICIIELTVSAIQNINKNINFISKIKGLEEKRNEELEKNKQLKSEIENFNSKTNLESIARNNLKMAGENEILLIINKPTEEQLKEANSNNNKNLKNK
ncbi:MAG: septum formation initiator family protein [Candidatus Gastranaerophilales bacterium]|nr:septum formation initiator family protein [Candidatus Gastranaerophilales bacterium]